MSFVNAHFVTYVQDLGYHKMVAAGAFSLIGAAAIIGALLLGHLSDQHGRHRLLSFSYNLRSMRFVLVLMSMGGPVPEHTLFRYLHIVCRGTPGRVLLERHCLDHSSLHIRSFWPFSSRDHLRHHVCRDALGVRPRRLSGRAAL